MYNKDILKKEKVYIDKDKQEEDIRVDIFAAEFLMPEDYVKKVFYKNINVKPDKVEEKHIIIMHNYFNVSYKAMLKRLIQLNLCSPKRYNRLLEIASLKNKDQLQALTKEEDFHIDLIIPSKVNYIPMEYLIYTKSNYENGLIDDEELKKALTFAKGE